MPALRLTTLIHAPRSRCFDLARSVDLHRLSTEQTREQIVAGVRHGLMGLHDEVTWRAWHLGVRQSLSSRITAFDPPHHFRDSMLRGAFARFDHDHFFNEHAGVTEIRDVFDYDAPLGPLGALAERLFLNTYLRRLLARRNQVIKRVAESDEWHALLP